MRIVVINQKTTWARRLVWQRWRFRFVWYRVGRGGLDWQPMDFEKRVPPKSIESIAKALNKKYPSQKKGAAGAAPGATSQ